MREQLNYNHLHHFWVAASERSLTRAAQRLRLTHSTLSTQLRRLEETVGNKLFVRKSRGIALTPFGDQLKLRCDELFRIGAALGESLSAGRIDAPQTVRIGGVPSLPRTLLFRALHKMTVGADAPTISYRSGDVDTLVDALVAGRLHAVLSDRPPSTAVDAHVYAHLLGETRIFFFGSAGLARQCRRGFPATLDGAPVLLPRPGATLREGLVGWFAQQHVRPRVVAEIDDVPLMKVFAAHGRGLVPIREPLADEARRVYGLRLVGVAEGVRDSLYALTLQKSVRHPDVQRMIAACRKALSRPSA